MGSPLTGREISWDGGGISEPLRRAQQPVCRRQNRETCTDGQNRCPALPSLRHLPADVDKGCMLKLRLQRSNPERDLGLAVRRQPEVAGVWCICNGGYMWNKPGPAREARCYCCGGGACEGRCATAIDASFPICILSGNRTRPT